MRPQKRDRVMISGATRVIVNGHRSWLDSLSRTSRWAAIKMIRLLCATQFRQMEAQPIVSGVSDSAFAAAEIEEECA
jgi:hypothetical protein